MCRKRGFYLNNLNIGCEFLFRNHAENAFIEIVAHFNANNTMLYSEKKRTVWTRLK